MSERTEVEDVDAPDEVRQIPRANSLVADDREQHNHRKDHAGLDELRRERTQTRPCCVDMYLFVVLAELSLSMSAYTTKS